MSARCAVELNGARKRATQAARELDANDVRMRRVCDGDGYEADWAHELELEPELGGQMSLFGERCVRCGERTHQSWLDKPTCGTCRDELEVALAEATEAHRA